VEIAFSDWVAVTDASSVGEVRRSALTAAHRLGMDETRSGEMALLATEVSRNVLLHGGGGHVFLEGLKEPTGPVARILALDKGAGIADVARAMSDGYSTGGTMGGGMGAMKRIATSLEFLTGRSGTIVLLELGQAASKECLPTSGIAVPIHGERHCGDGWDAHRTPERTLVLLTDGLGHGIGAAEAAKEAIATFRKRVQFGPGEILNHVHDALRKTRGAVAAIVEIRPKEQSLVYAGVGNISGVLHSRDGSKSLVSHNGTLGLTVPRIQEFKSEWAPDAVLVLHSDGVQSKWDLSSYPGLISRHPSVIAGALVRDFRRERDDASVVVVKAA